MKLGVVNTNTAGISSSEIKEACDRLSGLFGGLDCEIIEVPNIALLSSQSVIAFLERPPYAYVEEALEKGHRILMWVQNGLEGNKWVDAIGVTIETQKIPPVYKGPVSGS